jgi:hypothetical protein
MTAKVWQALTGLLLATGLVYAQSAPPAVHVESFRKGPTQIAEKKFVVDLDGQHSSYEVRLKDASGEERYVFSLAPQRVGGGDDRILAWQASLVDLHRRSYGNLLLASRDPYSNQGVKSAISRLDPNKYALVPVLATRVIKVEDFYCVLQVSKYHLLTPERWYLENLSVEVSLTNSNP